MLPTEAILDATLLPAMAVALTAGLLSFLSPCVLPIVPPYLAYMGGVSVGEWLVAFQDDDATWETVRPE